MKLLSYSLDKSMEPRLAFQVNDFAVDVMRAALWMKDQHHAQEYLNLPTSMHLALADWEANLKLLRQLKAALSGTDLSQLRVSNRSVAMPEAEIEYFPTVPEPPAWRRFNGFFSPASLSFEFMNTQTLLGHKQSLGNDILRPSPEIAAVIGTDRKGKHPVIAGFTILNNWYDPAVPPENPGMYWGQATTVGPYLITSDHLEGHRFGKGLNLEYALRFQGESPRLGSFRDMQISFEEMLETARPTKLKAGDLLSSGSPVSELPESPNSPHVDLEIQALGTQTSFL